MKQSFRAMLVAVGMAATPVLAADLPSQKAQPAAPLLTVATFDPWQIRLRLVDVAPTGGNNTVTTFGGAFVGKGLTVQSQIIPELDISYYFTRNIAVEAICCFSYHTIKPVNAITAVTGTANTGNTWVFPPTVLLQYHFTDFGAFQPYLGVGVNYTRYFNTNATGFFAGDTLKLDDTFGLAGQIGFDYMFSRNWGFNADIKYVSMQPRARYMVAGLKSNVAINPIIFGVGITYRFGGN